MNHNAEFEIWERLKKISSVSFTARSENRKTGWNGAGTGNVHVEIGPGGAIIFSEAGTCVTSSGTEMGFSNRYRWSLSTGQNVLGLEHLRYGNENPVKLLELACDADLRWKTSTPHTCNKDTYTLEMVCVASCIHMDWYVTGPVKNECIFYRYH